MLIATALVPAGVFQMGATEDEVSRFRDAIQTDWWQSGIAAEAPCHTVEILQPFELGIAPITVGQYRAFVESTGYSTEGEADGRGAYKWLELERRWRQLPMCTWRDPGFAQSDDHPVVCVSWRDAMAFCQWMTRKEQRTCRLPSEAEWEYACRGGTTSAFAMGDSLDATQANFDCRSESVDRCPGFIGGTTPVGFYPANQFGLFDMHGNVYEWCADWFDNDYYTRSPVVNPIGPTSGVERVVRGGAWNTVAVRCRSACRKSGPEEFRINRRGFRVVKEVT